MGGREERYYHPRFLFLRQGNFSEVAPLKGGRIQGLDEPSRVHCSFQVIIPEIVLEGWPKHFAFQ